MDPDFNSNVNLGGDNAQAGLNGDGSRRSREFQERFSPLAEFAAEGAEVARLLQDARVLPGERATEAEVKKLRGPRVLHMITHGFFQRKEKGKVKGPLEMPLSGSPSPWALTLNENPLLRSGLALAGANFPPRRGSNDGILTALETAGLDLWGTKLVTLSACETGVGAVENGEGVYGLRRALVLAGAESQVMSLWRVNDQATRELMVGYYKRLAAGEGRGEALRQVQLAILSDERYRHPYFWAGFIQSGDWRSLSSEELPPPADSPRPAGRRTKA
jgi:CHAT domain-containing protein